jgi:hypothetical protein
MSKSKTAVIEKPAEAQPTTAEGALVSGRTKYEAAMAKAEAAARSPELLESVRQFQNAIQMDPGSLEAYGWLAQTYRMIAAGIRNSDPNRAEMLTRYACAVAWEGTARASSAAAIPIRTKQEVRTLIAWLRTTRHLSASDAEKEMESMRHQCIRAALTGTTSSV